MVWIYFLLLIPLNMVLPSSWGRENGLIENLQLLCLLAGAVICYNYGKRKLNSWGGSQRALCTAGTLFFFLLTMREISWGRALMLHPDGSVYQYSEMGLYGKLVHPTVGVLLILLVYLLYRARVWNIFKIIEFPQKSFALLLLFVLMSWIGEKGNVTVFHGELAEELAELGVYIIMYNLVHKSLKSCVKKDDAM